MGEQCAILSHLQQAAALGADEQVCTIGENRESLESLSGKGQQPAVMGDVETLQGLAGRDVNDAIEFDHIAHVVFGGAGRQHHLANVSGVALRLENGEGT